MTLTDIQNAVIETAAQHENKITSEEIANEVGCSTSYANKVRNDYHDVIVERMELSEVLADGGEQIYTIRLSESAAWTAVRSVPTEVSREIFDQIRG